jgi:glyoxylase-like metal-dependent hydrolase (beta-lactamase superfamily II)
MKKVKLYLNYAGYCWAKENHAIKTGSNKQIKFHALWGLIEHPSLGYILYDTGYTEQFYRATARFPNKIYALITKVQVTKEDEVANQLKKHNIDPNEIQHVIVTHFHADHVSGLKDFPNAKIYTSSTALEHTLALGQTFAFTKGVLKELLPNDLSKRAVLIDKSCCKMIDPIFGEVYDLFGDNSIRVINLPGHAAGQIGLILETIKTNYFLIADACWLKESIEKNIMPNAVVKLFIHSWANFIDSISKIQKYHKLNPDTIIVPTHCFESTISLIQKKIDFDVL